MFNHYYGENFKGLHSNTDKVCKIKELFWWFSSTKPWSFGSESHLSDSVPQLYYIGASI
jgi:hypothetical protein